MSKISESLAKKRVFTVFGYCSLLKLIQVSLF